MDKPKQPTKEAVKQWLSQRAATRQPLPDQEAIRRQLGILMIEKTLSK